MASFGLANQIYARKYRDKDQERVQLLDATFSPFPFNALRLVKRLLIPVPDEAATQKAYTASDSQFKC